MKGVRRSRAPAWSKEEIAALREFYPEGGIDLTADMLPDRSWGSITTMASKMRLRSPIVGHAREPVLSGEQLEEAIRLREVDRWSFERIGKRFGVCETSASNAVVMALGPRRGFTPVPRDHAGRVEPDGIERIRNMLSAGRKAIDIQLECGVSAACVAEQRRRYRKELQDRGAPALPPPGGGMAYSGVKLPAAKKREIEAQLLDGYGAFKVGQRTGASHSSILRVRTRLIRRLKRRGETLPGCDFEGRRRVHKDSAHHIPALMIAELRRRILDREPVAIAAEAVGIGRCTAYRIRDQLVGDLAARGETLPPPKRIGRADAQRRAREVAWLPKDTNLRQRFRRLCRIHEVDEAKRIMLDELAAQARVRAEAARREAARPKTFEEQLEMVRRGARLVTVVPIRRSEPSYTLGGIATAAL